ncbi:apoptosis regulator Bcl-2a [Astyanax mexicanus]|uniref:Apoptosis regulator Bcl-2 isoform X1 n=1 Tax=Astyanax mexicanus TaxID=7994 RepID=A0A8B9LC08_ASTMX|nr:apoptosis regulator Bcl-2a [Astyanax mexicanus]KAG9283483.1 apoptosis regulator Bcl-2 isoform X1 [Astyanax mexicanus]
MANESPYDSRDIVEKYLYHKLLKRGYVWEFRPASAAASATAAAANSTSAASADDDNDDEAEPERAGPARLHRLLREAGDELERAYQRDFAAMWDQLRVGPSAQLQRSFVAVAEELFGDGVNWGRVVAFFEFGGTLCVESVNREMASQVEHIARWMTDYLNGPLLQSWIQDNGGWDGFVEIYSQQRRSIFHPWPYLKTVFGLAALGAAGVTIGALFTQK